MMDGTPAIEVAPDGNTVTVHVPITFRRRGGRKQVVSPEGALARRPARPRVDSTMVKAIARASRWQRMIESGAYGSIAELAAAERISASYLARVLRLTLVAPNIVEAILDGRHSTDLTLTRFFRSVPVSWAEQAGAVK